MTKGKFTVNPEVKDALDAMRERVAQAVRDTLRIDEHLLREHMGAPFVMAIDPASGRDKTVRTVSMRGARIRIDEIARLDDDDPHFHHIGDLVRKKVEEARERALLGSVQTSTVNQAPAEPVTFPKLGRIMEACGFNRVPRAAPFRFEPIKMDLPDSWKMMMDSYPLYRPTYPSVMLNVDPCVDYPTLSYQWTIPDTRRAMRAVRLYTLKPGDRRRRRRCIRILQHEIRNSG